jgi:uncharacterized protein (TIGR03083 family)
MALPPTDTRPLFRPVSAALASLLAGLRADAWERPTIAGTWQVRDVVAHIIDITLRRLSFHRDRMAPPPPPRPIASAEDFLAFINGINREWVAAARRLSPRVLTDLAARSTSELADWFEALPADAPALFGVSWAGEFESAGWLDVGRELAEVWHHQQQIRLAVGAPILDDPAILRPVLEIALRAFPHACREVGAEGDRVGIHIAGPAGGGFTLRRGDRAWTLEAGEPSAPAAAVHMSQDTAWRLLFHALPASAAGAEMLISGRADLTRPILSARAVIV